MTGDKGNIGENGNIGEKEEVPPIPQPPSPPSSLHIDSASNFSCKSKNRSSAFVTCWHILADEEKRH